MKAVIKIPGFVPFGDVLVQFRANLTPLEDKQEGDNQITVSFHHRDARFASKVGQIGLEWDKSGAFSDQISAPNALKSDLKKSRI